MEHSRQGNRLTIGSSATYRIRAQGSLDHSWSDRLAGMTILVGWEGGQAPVITLVGRLRDQAELMGVLNSLYDMHLPLLSLELLSGE